MQRRKVEIEAQMKRKAAVEEQLRGGGVEPDRKVARWELHRYHPLLWSKNNFSFEHFK